MVNMAKELRKKTTQELTELIIKCKEQLLQIRFSIANGETEKASNINELKKTIARSFTILNERMNTNQKESNQNQKKASTKKGNNK